MSAPLASLTVTPLEPQAGEGGTRASDTPSGPSGRTRLPRQPPFGQQLFTQILSREAGRAVRSDSELSMLTIAAADGGQLGATDWDRVAAAVGTAVRDTDIIGWRSRGTVLGVVLTDARRPDCSASAEIERRVVDAIEREARLETPVPLTVALGAPVPDAHGNVRSTRPARDRYDTVKRLIDLAGSLVLLGVLSPLLVVIAIAVKLGSPGPALFKQIRIGYLGRSFTMLKFRTMHVDVGDAIHQQFVQQLIDGETDGESSARGGTYKIVDDPRTTGLGRFLRRTSFDELPQLWNVVVGEMSLVGPRPPLPYEVERYKAWHRGRLYEARPGVTGLWQVAGRSRTTFDEMVRLDLRYARSRSLWTDLKILLATPRAVIEGRGAH